jgi:tetratricopeptide (TPR) repeat protein
MKRSTLALIAAFVCLPPAPQEIQGQPAAEKYQHYESKYKKRGKVHGIVLSLPFPQVYAGVTKAFTDLGLTVNYEEPTLGYVEGGRSRGVAAEVVRVWIDPEESGRHRVEVRNLRITRMGLLGLTMTKDWSLEVLSAVDQNLSRQPTLAQLHAAVDADPDALEARRQLIEALTSGGQFDDAVAAYRALLARHPGSVLDRMKCADWLLARAQSEQALELLKQAGGQDPEVIYGLARIYLQTGQVGEAVKLLQPLSQADPADLKARFQLARAAFLAGEVETAKTNFASVIERAPQHPFAEQSKVWLKLAEGGAISHPPAAATALALSEALEKEGLPALARHYLEALPASASAAERAQAYGRLARLYRQSGQHEAVVRLLEPHAEEFKKQKQGDLLYALCLAQCGLRQFDAALNYLKQAQKLKHPVARELEQALKLYKG